MTPTRSPEGHSSATEARTEPDHSGQPATAVQTLKFWFFETILPLALAFLVVFAIRSSVIEAFKIPSGSMIPTLLIGDHIFVNKFSYGVKIPFSDLVGDRPIHVIKRDPPKRGDIIVFTFPKDPSINFIKRVIGVPGDVIEIRDNQVYINGRQVERKPVNPEEERDILASFDDGAGSKEGTLRVYDETLDQGPHKMMVDETSFSINPMNISEQTFCMRTPCTVPADRLFVMGDNRDHSNDSRYWGYVPLENVKGRAMFIWLSMVINFSAGEFTFRPERFGQVLQ